MKTVQYTVEAPPAEGYAVTLWDTGEIVSTHTEIAHARKAARDLGHNGEEHRGMLKYFPPNARVDLYEEGANKGCTYNPRFAFSKPELHIILEEA